MPSINEGILTLKEKVGSIFLSNIPQFKQNFFWWFPIFPF
jgi:hypothetical protein